MTSATASARRRKMTDDEKAKAILRLRSKLEISLVGYHGNFGERRFLKSMIDLLYCVRFSDSDAEIIIDSVRQLTSKRRLQNAFSRSAVIYPPGGGLLIGEHRMHVLSPSEQFRY